jgi:hypothetical protein
VSIHQILTFSDPILTDLPSVTGVTQPSFFFLVWEPFFCCFSLFHTCRTTFLFHCLQSLQDGCFPRSSSCLFSTNIDRFSQAVELCVSRLPSSSSHGTLPMCGITFTLSPDELPSELFEGLCTACQPRGPDYQGGTIVKHVSSNFYLHFYAAVLHLRGNHVARQPFQDGEDVLIYVRISCTTNSIDLTNNLIQNGEIFDGIDVSASMGIPPATSLSILACMIGINISN